MPGSGRPRNTHQSQMVFGVYHVALTGGIRPWELMGATLADGSIAILIILAMSFGLIVPMLIIDYVSAKVTKS